MNEGVRASLPGWSALREAVGDGGAARALYVRLLRAETGLLELAERVRKLAGDEELDPSDAREASLVCRFGRLLPRAAGN